MSASMTVKEKTTKTSDVTKTCHRPARKPYPRFARQATSIGFGGSMAERCLRKTGKLGRREPAKGRAILGSTLHTTADISHLKYQ